MDIVYKTVLRGHLDTAKRSAKMSKHDPKKTKISLQNSINLKERIENPMALSTKNLADTIKEADITSKEREKNITNYHTKLQNLSKYTIRKEDAFRSPAKSKKTATVRKSNKEGFLGKSIRG